MRLLAKTLGNGKAKKMTECEYQLLKDFQTLIVGVIGFGGVVLTLLANSWMSRRKQTQLIEHETCSLRTALIAELEQIEKSFKAKAIPVKEEEQPSGAFHPKETQLPIYENFVGKFGLLTKEEVSVVIKAYNLVNEAPTRIQLLSVNQHPSFEKPGYSFVGPEHEESASGIYANFVKEISNAIATLKSHQDG